MAKTDNLTDFLTDIADAIREKKGTTGKINPQDFSSEIASIESGDSSKPQWTGHADTEGLRAIGWTDEDIAYYQANGVNWNAEDDEYHLVSDDNKALYGVLTANNISTYRDRIVYLPKIDTSNVTNMANKFFSCRSLISIPQLDTSNVTNMSRMFQNCYSLVSIPQLDTSNVTTMSDMFYYCRSLVSLPQLDTSNVKSMSEMFYGCRSLASIPQLDTSSVTNMDYMFSDCYSLISIPQLDTSNVTNMSGMLRSNCSLISIPQLDTSNVTDISSMFYYCDSLISIPQLDTPKVTNMASILSSCFSVQYLHVDSLRFNLDISSSNLISKESLLYIINNEAATSAITIKLASYAYTRLAEDAGVLEALANHPNISISQ